MLALDSVSDWVRLARSSHYNSVKLANLCHVSSSQMQRYFARVFLRPPQEWMDELRLWDATRLLVQGRSIKEITFDLGFGGVSHFCHRFKEYHGCTPSEFVSIYRKRRSRNSLKPGKVATRRGEPWRMTPWRAAIDILATQARIHKCPALQPSSLSRSSR